MQTGAGMHRKFDYVVWFLRGRFLRVPGSSRALPAANLQYEALQPGYPVLNCLFCGKPPAAWTLPAPNELQPVPFNRQSMNGLPADDCAHVKSLRGGSGIF